jgi:hypothetical protein
VHTKTKKEEEVDDEKENGEKKIYWPSKKDTES